LHRVRRRFAAAVNADLISAEGTLNAARLALTLAPHIVTIAQQHSARGHHAANSINEKSGLSFNVKRRLKFGWLNRSIVLCRAVLRSTLF
jgi:hypothetical protein